MKRFVTLLLVFGIAFAFFPALVSAQSNDELIALRKALEESLRENVALRADLEAARAEIDRLRGGAVRPIAAVPMQNYQSGRFHSVSEGETLGQISAQYYGTPSAFNKIFEANRNIISNPNMIYPGQKLIIP